MEFESLEACPYCKQEFCSYHTDPSLHDCTGSPVSDPYQIEYSRHTTPSESVKISHIDAAPAQQMYSEKELERVETSGGYKWHIDENYIPKHAFDKDSGVEMKGIFWRAGSEFMHLLIAAILMYSMGFIANFNAMKSGLGTALAAQYSAIYALLSLAAFMVHEFAHRQTAVYYGFQTQFRLVSVGVLITVVSIIIGGGFGVPGAVVIIGLDNETTREQTGMCKAAGPFSNVIFGTILLGLAFFLPDSVILARIFLLQGALFNYALGAFNLLPVSILDGANIIRWKKSVWLFLIISCIIGIVGYYGILNYLTEIYIKSLYTI
jgi:Zn-dependent protease